MLKCTISAAGGISHLLKPGPAVILSLDKNPLMTAPFLVSIPRRIRDRGCYVDALQVSTGGCVGQMHPVVKEELAQNAVEHAADCAEDEGLFDMQPLDCP